MSKALQPYQPIREIAPDLFCVDGEWFETAFRRRMTVIRLKNGSLVVHSGIEMEEKDLAALDRLGPVATIVVPNIFHDSDAGFYATRYPGAAVYVPASVRAKCAKKMRVAGTLEENWPHAEELACIPFVNTLVAESALVHRASRTLVLADLAFNVSAEDFKSPIERKILGDWNGLLKGFGPSRLTKYVAARSHVHVGAALKKVAAEDFDRVIVSHGKIVETGGKRQLLDSYERLYGFAKYGA